MHGIFPPILTIETKETLIKIEITPISSDLTIEGMCFQILSIIAGLTFSGLTDSWDDLDFNDATNDLNWYNLFFTFCVCRFGVEKTNNLFSEIEKNMNLIIPSDGINLN